MTHEKKRPRGRPPSWSSRITGATPKALALYRAIEAVQNSKDFEKCHVFTGTVMNHIPIISWKNEIVKAPKLFLQFFNAPFGASSCGTHGCINPFHYIDYRPTPLTGLVLPETEKVSREKEPFDSREYIEAIEHVMDLHNLPKSTTFDTLRSFIPKSDIDDFTLQLCFERMHNDYRL